MLAPVDARSRLPAPESPSERQRAKWTKEAKTHVPSIAVEVQAIFDWGHPAWAALRFRPATPHRYSYEYVAEGKSFVVKAVGDLDCDGERSTYEIRGRITDSGELDIVDRGPTAANPLE